MFLITPSALLMECPRCQSDLSNNKESDDKVICVCGYSEPKSSARVLTFIESALDNYLRTIKIDTFRSDDKLIDSTTGVSAAGCLPIFVSRAAELFSKGAPNEESAIFQIKNIPDREGYLEERCVTTAHNIDVPFTLLMLVEVVHEAIDLKPTFKQKHYPNELPVKHLIEGHSYGQTGSVMDVSLRRSMHPSSLTGPKPRG